MSSDLVNDVCVAWQKALREIGCNVVDFISHCNPLDVSLKQNFCKFSNGIFKHGSMVLKAIATMSKNNPFSVYGNHYVEISSKYNGDPYESNISNTIYKKWFETISEELQNYFLILLFCNT